MNTRSRGRYLTLGWLETLSPRIWNLSLWNLGPWLVDAFHLWVNKEYLKTKASVCDQITKYMLSYAAGATVNQNRISGEKPCNTASAILKEMTV